MEVLLIIIFFHYGLFSIYFGKVMRPKYFFIENMEKYINSDGQTVLIKLNIEVGL